MVDSDLLREGEGHATRIAMDPPGHEPVELPGAGLEFLVMSQLPPSLEILAKWEREDRIHGGSFAGRRGGCMLIDAASTEELADLLMTLPFWGLQVWTITPLTSDEAAAKRFRELSQRLKSAGQPQPVA